MNDTNRGLNRTVLFIVGLLFLTVGAAGIAMAGAPQGADAWRAITTNAVRWMQNADQESRITHATTLSWFVIGVLALLVLIVVAVVVIITRLGGGRSTAVLYEGAGDGVQGPVTIRDHFAVEAITGSLDEHAAVLSSHVSVRRMQGEDVLHVSVTPRQGTSPVTVAETVERLVDNLAIVTGRSTPTVVSIRSGIRSRLATEQSRVG